MKAGTVGLIILMFVIAACNPQVQPAPEAGEPPSAPQEPLSTPEPAAPPTATPEPSPTPDPKIFQDDFEGTLAQGWWWLKENRKEWNLTDNPGWLEIYADAGHVSDGKIENILIRQAPEGDFELETKLNFKPVTNYQFAGLLIYENDANFVQFGRAHCINNPLCVGDGLYLDNTIGGNFIVGDNYSTRAPDTDTLYLRLRREGDIITGYFSDDGNNWQMVGPQSNSMNVVNVGLVAGQSTYSFQRAQFDYFSITLLQ